MSAMDALNGILRAVQLSETSQKPVMRVGSAFFREGLSPNQRHMLMRARFPKSHRSIEITYQAFLGRLEGTYRGRLVKAVIQGGSWKVVSSSSKASSVAPAPA